MFPTSCHLTFQNAPIYISTNAKGQCLFHCNFANNEFQHFCYHHLNHREKEVSLTFFLLQLFDYK